MYLRESENEFGTRISVFTCDQCSEEFTVCPAVEPWRHDEWTGCMAETCESYEPTRDAELYFSLGMVEKE
jgi:hypothetical protein